MALEPLMKDEKNMLEILRVTLESVGHSIFNIVFIFGVWIVFLINRRLYHIDIYRIIKKKSIFHVMADILVQSIIIGSIMSFIIVFVGVPLFFNAFLVFLIPISLLLSMIRIRFLDIHYSAALISVMTLVLNGQYIGEYVLPNIEAHIPSLMLLVGMLNVIKGLMIWLTQDQSVIPVLSRKNNQIVMGHIIHKSWILPMGILLLQIGELLTNGIQMPPWWPILDYGYSQSVFFSMLPFVAMLSHNSISYTQTLKNHKKQYVWSNLIIGSIMIVIGFFALHSLILQVVGTLMMIILPEAIHWMRLQKERKTPPIYSHPESGLRIMEVIDGGVADELGMEMGEVIEKVNDTLIHDFKHFLRMIKDAKEQIVIESRTISGRMIRYEIHKTKDLSRMGVRFIPEKPLITYSMENYNHIGLLDFLKGNYK